MEGREGGGRVFANRMHLHFLSLEKIIPLLSLLLEELKEFGVCFFKILQLLLVFLVVIVLLQPVFFVAFGLDREGGQAIYQKW
jgi:hypothetical protein